MDKMEEERTRILMLQHRKVAEAERDYIRARKVCDDLLQNTFKDAGKAGKKIHKHHQNNDLKTTQSALERWPMLFGRLEKGGRDNAKLLGKQIGNFYDKTNEVDVERHTLKELEQFKEAREMKALQAQKKLEAEKQVQKDQDDNKSMVKTLKEMVKEYEANQAQKSMAEKADNHDISKSRGYKNRKKGKGDMER